jgi:hypothetical protein
MVMQTRRTRKVSEPTYAAATGVWMGMGLEGMSARGVWCERSPHQAVTTVSSIGLPVQKNARRTGSTKCCRSPTPACVLGVGGLECTGVVLYSVTNVTVFGDTPQCITPQHTMLGSNLLAMEQQDPKRLPGTALCQ